MLLDENLYGLPATSSCQRSSPHL